jgi:membrane protease YdiL (CAAX protease family)
LPLLMIAVAIALGIAFFGTPSPIFSTGLIVIVAVEFVRILVLSGPLGEELGWRGFALPRTKRHRSAFDGSNLWDSYGVLWHVPLYFVPATGPWEPQRRHRSGLRDRSIRGPMSR